MSTEDRSDKFIDEMKPYSALTHLLNELDAPSGVRGAKSQIHKAVGAIAKRLSSGNGRLVYIGAGTSGRLGVQDGAELWPTFGWPKERFAYLIAGGDPALTRSIEGAEDNAESGVVQMRLLNVSEKDVIIALAASGSTPFTLAAMREAKERGALTVGIANNADGRLLAESQCPIFLDTGAEPVAGSTRMKAGTSQCVVLKILSTLAMVRLGYVYEGLMINVRAVNAKLKRRAIEMVQVITGCDKVQAQKALEEAQWEVGVAVLTRRGNPLPCAQSIFLKIHERSLRDALKVDELVKATR